MEIQFIFTAIALNFKKMVKMMDTDRLRTDISDRISGTICIFRNILRSFPKELVLEWS